MMLAAIETMAKPYPIGLPHRHDPDIAAQTTASETLHVEFLRNHADGPFKVVRGARKRKTPPHPEA